VWQDGIWNEKNTLEKEVKVPETVHCSICNQAIHGKNFQDIMAKLRRHRKSRHPKAFKASIRKGIETRKLNS